MSVPKTAASVPASPAAETARLYAGDWTAFATWCDTTGRTALPADPTTVAAFLAEAADRLSYGTLARRCAAIAAMHRLRHLPPPGLPSEAKALLRGLRARPPRRKAVVASLQMLAMARRCGGDLRGRRDRAILLLLAAGLGRRVVVALDAEQVSWTPAGMAMTVQPDSTGAGHVVTVPRHAEGPVCPVRSLEDWMRASDTGFGPLFRKVDRWGNVEHSRLGADAIRRILTARSLRLKRTIPPRKAGQGRAGDEPPAS
ncbi:hypothetical protein ACELLULO517_26985 [Acidisoma cellulosilytica]|uniref:Integrase n=1 Tax=Acidisoma cellulosilyticum TaxID=2802395 RepID=A0A964E6T8_9PROT|nr:hypothetical protein [Acidisoma cellulosilyticum]MCB8883921.1 hypothetical protein [Acidisoma cellulosilyticum]